MKGGNIVNGFEAARRRAGLTQDCVADVLRIDRSTVSKWESGLAMPRANLIKQLAMLYGCTADSLLEDGDPNEN